MKATATYSKDLQKEIDYFLGYTPPQCPGTPFLRTFPSPSKSANNTSSVTAFKRTNAHASSARNTPGFTRK